MATESETKPTQVREVIARFNVSYSTAVKWIRSGDLDARIREWRARQKRGGK